MHDQTDNTLFQFDKPTVELDKSDESHNLASVDDDSRMDGAHRYTYV